MCPFRFGRDGFGDVSPVVHPVRVTQRQRPSGTDSWSLFRQRTTEDGRYWGREQAFLLPLTAKVMTIQLGRCVTPNPLRFPSGLISMFAQHSNLVCRPFSIWGRAAWRKTGRRSRANLTRKRVFGGAWPPSSPVRRPPRARSCLSVHAERVLLERAQDRGRAVRWLWPWFRRLRTSPAPAPHGPQRTCGRLWQQ